MIGTVATILPSAQAQPYEMNNGYGSYEPREYPPQYSEGEYNSYQSTYEKDSYKDSDRNDYYEQQEYSSYKEEYPKYVKDNNEYQPKKDSVSINKVNCVNNNVNINGNNTGDINVGNSGSLSPTLGTEYGYLGFGSNGNGEGYDKGYNKEQGVTCIINNNNTNNNFGAGNTTDDNGNELSPCEQCIFGIFTPEQIEQIEEAFDGMGIMILIDPTPPQEFVTVNSFTEFCEFLENIPDLDTGLITSAVNALRAVIDPIPDDQTLIDLVACIADALGIETDNGIVAPFDINTEPSDFPSNTGGRLASFDVHNDGTGDLSALEKITKLKQQWMELTP